MRRVSMIRICFVRDSGICDIRRVTYRHAVH